MIKQMEDKTRQSRARQRPSLICGVSAHTFFHTHSYTDATRGCVSFLCLFVPYDPSFFAAALRLFFFFSLLPPCLRRLSSVTSNHILPHNHTYTCLYHLHFLWIFLSDAASRTSDSIHRNILPPS